MTPPLQPDAPEVAPRDAATVVLLRDGNAGPEVFFVKRHAASHFMGGAYVFPGGKLDVSDCDPGVPGDLGPEEASTRLVEPDATRSRGLYVAAARECLEEAGVLFAAGSVEAETVAALRHACDIDRAPLASALVTFHLSLQLSALRPFSRWVTPRSEPRRFDARFFVAAAPPGARASHDTHETVESAWLSPREAIVRALRKEIVLMPPTFRTVQQLMHARSVAEALDLAPSGLEPRMPRITSTDGGDLVILLPDDPEHSTTNEAVPVGTAVDPTTELATRFVFGSKGWQPGRLFGRS